MTIAEAARDVLRAEGRPMTVEEIYEAIVSRGLVEFKTTQPKSVLRNQIRRHCVGVQHAAPAAQKYFVQTDPGRYRVDADDSA